MKIIEVVKFNRELLKNLRACGVRLDDCDYVSLYDDFEKLSKNEKVTYVVHVLSTKYRLSESKVYELLRRFRKDCRIFEVE